MLDETYYNAIVQLKPTLFVVSISSGVPSAVTAKRVIDVCGRDNVRLVFADTQWEDDDNYRFLDDVERVLDMPIIRLTEGRKPLEVAKDEHIIPNNKIAPCTKRLKLEVIQTYVDTLLDDYNVIMCIGMDYTDVGKGRLEAPRRNWGERGATVAYPLLWKPVIYDTIDVIKSMGIEPPRMYAQGYSHANCGGRCVKQGAKDWRRTLRLYPERFAEAEAWETEMRKDERFAQWAFLRRVENNIMRGLPLSELREETEAADARQLRLFEMIDDIGDVCGVECGIA